MVLRATDEDVYEVMDSRERCLAGAGGSTILGLLFLHFISRGMWNWELVYLLLASGICTFLSLTAAIRMSRQIMETRNCYLEVTKECLVVRQMESHGNYESCRIFLDEIEKIVEGSRPGIPEFYVVLRENAEKSFILLGQEEKAGHIFLVKSFGYKTAAFRRFYRRLKWEVPGSVHIVGTKKQELWKMKKPRGVFRVFAGLFLLYLVPKIALLLFL